MIAYCFVMSLMVIGFFDDVFRVIWATSKNATTITFGKISIQSVIIFDKILSFVNRWDKEIKETIIWPEKSFKIAKLKPFVSVNLTNVNLL